MLQRGSIRYPRLKTSGHAFTLVEILVVLVVVGILAALAISVANGARGRAMSATCISNLRQLHTAVALYAADHDNLLPPYQNFIGVTHFENGVTKPIPENGDLLVQSLSRYTTSRQIWFCLADVFAGTSSTAGHIRHAYSSYHTPVQMGYWTLNGLSTTMEGPEARRSIDPSRLTLLRDNLWFHDAPEPETPLYSHGGTFNYLFFDGHVKSYPYLSTPE